jgi:glyoxylase-like metal-dependent hydrolase (beta-lactamase superfamily II)
MLAYPLGLRAPGSGETIELLPGLYWLRMPLPSALKHINLWLLEDGDGWAVVDCGIFSEALKGLWEEVFVSRLGGRPVTRVIATHMHSDHLGLAHWLCERFDAEFWISDGDYRRARQMVGVTAEKSGEALVAHLIRHGVSDAVMLDTARRQPSPYPSLVPSLPAHYHRIADDDEIVIGGQSWRAIAGHGHSPEHMALHCASLGALIGGDMLLPQITTYVGVSAIEPQANPLPEYLDSIGRFLSLTDATLVLPSHGQPFRGIAARIAELKVHHAERLRSVEQACSVPRSAAEIVPLLFSRPLDSRNYLLALGETLAHLHALVAQDVLQQQCAANGVIRFVQDPA